jgi:hypothetical protein
VGEGCGWGGWVAGAVGRHDDSTDQTAAVVVHTPEWNIGAPIFRHNSPGATPHVVTPRNLLNANAAAAPRCYERRRYMDGRAGLEAPTRGKTRGLQMATLRSAHAHRQHSARAMHLQHHGVRSPPPRPPHPKRACTPRSCCPHERWREGSRTRGRSERTAWSVSWRYPPACRHSLKTATHACCDQRRGLWPACFW